MVHQNSCKIQQAQDSFISKMALQNVLGEKQEEYQQTIENFLQALALLNDGLQDRDKQIQAI